MINKIVFVLVLLFFTSSIAFAAEKTPISITPLQVISTTHDEVEVGDPIDFKVVKDVYKEDKLIIKKGSPVEAEVDYVSSNGWAADAAYIQFRNFKILTAQNKWITVPYTLKIKGSDCLKSTNAFYKGCFLVKSIIRGSEISLKPNQRNFNIFLID